MSEMTDETFETYRASVLDDIKEKDQNIIAEGKRFWGEIEK